MKKLNIDEILKRINDKFGNEYEIIGKYINVDSPLIFKHLKCGNEWEQTYYRFINGNGCRFCNKKPQYNLLSLEDYQKKVYEKYGEQYSIIEYKGGHDKLIYKHNFFYNSKGEKIICDHVDISTYASNFLSRHGKRSFCSYCRGHKLNLDIDYELNKNQLYCIYKHINKLNNKIYIGITFQTFKERWNNGLGYYKQDYFYNSIKKNGWNNFVHYAYFFNKWVKVDENDDLRKQYYLKYDEVRELEKKFIKKYRKQFGKVKIYNITDGGEGIIGINEKRVVQIDLNGKFIKSFDSIKQASEFTGCSYGGISNCCNHNIHHSGGYIWRFEKDKSPLIIPEKIVRKNIKVYQYDLNGNFIQDFNSIKDASLYFKCSSSLITQCCNGEINSAKRYIFRFYKIEKLKNIKNLSFGGKRKVYQFALSGKYIRCYTSISEAEKLTGCASIWNCCNKNQYQSGGYIWTYKKEDISWYIKKINSKRNVNQKYVYKYDLNKKLIKKYNSVKECAQDNNISKATVGRHINGKLNIFNKKYIFLTDENNNEKELNKRINNLM